MTFQINFLGFSHVKDTEGILCMTARWAVFFVQDQWETQLPGPAPRQPLGCCGCDK